MGRPPLSPDDVTVKTTLRLPRRLLLRVEGITGANRMSGWVRRAIEEKLERDLALRVVALVEDDRGGTAEDRVAD